MDQPIHRRSPGRGRLPGLTAVTLGAAALLAAAWFIVAVVKPWLHVRSLLARLESLDGGAREAAAAELGELRRPEGIPRLLEILRRQRPVMLAGGRSLSDDLRGLHGCARLLVRHETTSVPLLIDGLEDRDIDVQLVCVWTLGSIGPWAPEAAPGLIARLGSPSRAMQYAAAEALGAIGPAARAAIPPLLGRIGSRDEGSPPDVAVRRIGAADPRDLPQVVAALGSPIALVRRRAAEVLGKMGTDAASAVPALAARLGDGDAGATCAALEALERMGLAGGQAGAIGALLRHPEPSARFQAARALAALKSGAAPAIPALLALLEDRRDPLRFLAVPALVAIGDPAGAALREVSERDAPARKQIDEERERARRGPAVP